MSFIPSDEQARKRVRENLNVAMAVEAGAGTGKTTLLIDRLLRLLSLHPLPSIVAITYTEKAAGELVERMRGELETAGRPGGALESSPRRRIEALGDLDRAHISTIHSFASSLIRSDAYDIHIDPDFDHLDDSDQDQMIEDMLSEAFAINDHERDSEIIEFLSIGGSFKRIRELAGSLINKLTIIDKYDAAPQDFDIVRASKTVLEERENWRKFALENCTDVDDKGYRQIAAVSSGAVASSNSMVVIKQLKEIANLGKSLGVKKNWQSSSLPTFKEGIAQIKGEAQAVLDRYYGLVLRRIVGHVSTLVGALQERKRLNGLLTFSDQLYYSLKLLEDPALRAEISKRFESILIDEFQDTDPIQVEIAMALMGLSKPGASGKLCVVGDIKQSIYHFRGADARLFRRVTNQIAESGERVSIDQNFRSASQIIEFVNAFFSRLWNGEDGTDAYIPLKALPNRPETAPLPSVEFLDPPPELEAGELNAEEVRYAEAEAIAAAILEAVENKWQVLDKGLSGGAVRDVSWGDIVILMPAMTGVSIFATFLSEYGIPVRVEKEKEGMKRQFVRDLLNVIRAIDNPADKLAVVGAVRSSLLGASDPEIDAWAESCKNRFDIFNPPSEISSHLLGALNFLKDLYGRKQSLTVVQVLQEIAQKAEFETIQFGHSSSNRDAELWSELLGLGYRESLAGQSLRHFRRALERMAMDEAILQDNSSLNSTNSVRIMTIHSAKGLEFPVVVLANCHKSNRRKHNVLYDYENSALHVSFPTTGKERISTDGWFAADENEKKELNEEKLRLLYVAMTRARDHLVISNINLAKDNQFNEWFSEFREIYDSAPTRLYGVRPHVLKAHRSVHTQAEVVDPLVNEVKKMIEALKQSRVRMKMKIKDDAVRFVRPSQAVPGAEDKEVREDAFSSSESTKAIGNAVHQYMANAPLSDQIDRELLERCCRVSNADFDSVLPKVEAYLKTELWRRAIDSGKVRREVPICYVENNSFVRGVIDLLWEEESNYFIVDYKTGSFDASRQKLQVDSYAKALEKNTGKKVAGKWLIYSSGSDAVGWV